MENVFLLIEQLVFAVTWAVLHARVCSKSRIKNTLQIILFAIVVGGVTFACEEIDLAELTPAINIVISSLLNGIRVKRQWKEIVVESISTYVVARLIWLGAIACMLLLFNILHMSRPVWVECLCNCAIQIIFSYILIRRTNLSKWEIFLSKYSFIMIVLAGTLFAVSLSVIVVPYIRPQREFYIFASVVIAGSVAILLVWVRSEFQHQREETNQSKHIEKLIRDVHKYKEVIPSAERELRQAQKKMLAEQRWETAAEIGDAIDELVSLGDTISAQGMKELAETPDFATTGLRLLDCQLQNEQEMAAAEGISFSCLVTSPAAFLVRSGVIEQFHLQQMVGDLVRNAIRAVRLREGRDKRLLLVMGETPEGYEIKLCDTGIPFPREMLRHFGQRGLTTGGSGHGLADLRVIMAGCRGSITVTEYGEEGSYTKAVSLLMDGRGILRIRSEPEGLDYEQSLLEPAESAVE